MRKIRKTFLALLLFMAVLVVHTATSMASAAAEGAPMETLVAGNSSFALNLYGQLRSTEGNLFFSPFSISSALGMTYAGARQNTAKEMGEALYFQIGQGQLPSAFKRLNHELAANACQADQKLKIANGLCLTGGEVSSEFKALLKDNYDAELFSGGVDRINGWVKEKTEGKIEKILEGLESNSVCVLLNAIYFKGQWESQFKTRDTHDAPFQVSPGREVTVPFMFQKSNYQILKKPDFQAASLPYKGKLLSMVILLPNKADGLGNLESQLTRDNLQQWLAELKAAPAEKTELYLPKFKLETGYDLVPPCQALGMKDAFDDSGKADFSGMGWRKGELWISQIKHKAFVEVNEEGTEAAAATVVAMVAMALREPPVFRADHPFLFLIRDNSTGSILFLGRMVNPKS
ncbi:serpin B [Syntrophus gentianae]|uniref:Serpin B n=1 Tax=Syntrophus gentianae TaxID=43775 RepID=A0A1H8AL45_9BACT|nr:serpin family protein [Syntrophus gentianae]SEM70257.1 serpin B [Syntrophus gentianae]